MKDSSIRDELKTFDNTLDQILELLDSDTQQFIYLTGAAGTGKTTLIEKVLEENKLKKIVVAPTGVAALNIGGSTPSNIKCCNSGWSYNYFFEFIFFKDFFN